MRNPNHIWYGQLRKELKQKYITEEKIYKEPATEKIEKELKTTKEFIEEIDQTHPEVEEITSLLKEVITQGQHDELQSKGKESDLISQTAPSTAPPASPFFYGYCSVSIIYSRSFDISFYLIQFAAFYIYILKSAGFFLAYIN